MSAFLPISRRATLRDGLVFAFAAACLCADSATSFGYEACDFERDKVWDDLRGGMLGVNLTFVVIAIVGIVLGSLSVCCDCCLEGNQPKILGGIGIGIGTLASIIPAITGSGGGCEDAVRKRCGEQGEAYLKERIDDCTSDAFWQSYLACFGWLALILGIVSIICGASAMCDCCGNQKRAATPAVAVVVNQNGAHQQHGAVAMHQTAPAPVPMMHAQVVQAPMGQVQSLQPMQTQTSLGQPQVYQASVVQAAPPQAMMVKQ